MAFTSHGHHIPGTVLGKERPDKVMRCGGPDLCTVCSREASLYSKQLNSQPAEIIEEETEFEKDLGSLLNRHSMENGSGTPDFILARYLKDQLDLFNRTIKERSAWRGERLDAIFDVKVERKVKVVEYGGDLNMRNEIGEAELTLWPGEVTRHGGVPVEVIAVYTAEGTSDFGIEDGG